MTHSYIHTHHKSSFCFALLISSHFLSSSLAICLLSFILPSLKTLLTPPPPPPPPTMNFSDYHPRPSPSPRRELQLQGPRPTPLKLSKDSYKIKKPPMAPPHSHLKPSAQPSTSDHQPRPPVIIYTVSPKVIHTNPTDFMALVQRLTGPSTSDEPSLPSPSGCFSPAARLATYERTCTSPKVKVTDYNVERGSSKNLDMELDQLGIGGGSTCFDRQSLHHIGVLSPMPSSLPAIPSNFFSSSSDAHGHGHTLGFQYDQQSPAGFHGGSKSFVDNTFLVSPNNGFLSSPALPSPSSYWDLFNQYQDF